MKTHLVFQVRGTAYALPAAVVRASFWLPELSPVEGLPAHFIGLVNRHGTVLPIVDLAQLFGHSAQALRLDQSVVLVEWSGRRLGLLSDAVSDLVELDEAHLDSYVELDGETADRLRAVIAGTARLGDRVLIRLDAWALADLVHGSELPQQLPAATEDMASARLRPEGLDAHRQALLQRRTESLASPETGEPPALAWYALLDIGGARYAIDAAQVSEFGHLTHLTPLPCCPPHILGCVNRRGAIVNVIDAAPFLRAPAASLGPYRQLAVLQLEGQAVGLAVHEVIDIRGFGPQASQSLAGQAYGHPHCKVLLHDDEGTAAVLDLASLHAEGLLEVNERT